MYQLQRNRANFYSVVFKSELHFNISNFEVKHLLARELQVVREFERAASPGWISFWIRKKEDKKSATLNLYVTRYRTMF